MLAEKVFAAQDAEARRLERRALLEAGVLHQLDLRADEVAPAAGPDASSPEPTPPATRAEREAGYVKLRLRRFRQHLAEASTRTGKVRT